MFCFMQKKISSKEAPSFNHEWETKCGLDYKQIEASNSHLDDSLYPHLGPEALYTSFADYFQLLSTLPSTVNHVCDLGAGVGRLAPIWKEIRKDGEVSLVEIVESRMKSAKEIASKLELSGVHFFEEDLLLSSIPKADAYFIYLPVSKVLEKIISDLRLRGKECFIVCIESHGNLYERLSTLPELELINTVDLFSKRHNPLGHIYKFTPKNLELDPFDIALSSSFKNKVVTVKEKSGSWIGLSEDLVWSSPNELLLKYPPRTISKESIISVSEVQDLAPEVAVALDLMRESTPFKGSLIRKIWIGPELKLELLSGAIIPFQKSDFT